MNTQIETLEPEVAEWIDSLLPGMEKELGKAPVKLAVKSLFKEDPDQVLQWYLDDQLTDWLEEKVKSFVSPDEDPADITIGTVRDYISRRYPRYLEYADYHSALAKLDQQGGDVLHEVIISILLKDEDQLVKLYLKKKKNQAYRELDFYILRMIKLNCHSKTSPYRWKYRQPLTDGNSSVDSLNNQEEDETFLSSLAYEEQEDEQEDAPEELITLRFRVIRDILSGPQFTEFERQVFSFKFFLENNWKDWPGEEKSDLLTKTYRFAQEKLIEEVAREKERHDLKVIDQTFAAAKYMDLRISKSEFLFLRVVLSELQTTDENNQPSAVTAPDGSRDSIRILEKRLSQKLSQMIHDFEIPDKF